MKPVRGSAKVMQEVREADPGFEYRCSSCSTAKSVHCILSCKVPPTANMLECASCKNRYHYSCVNLRPPGTAVQQRGSERLVREIRDADPCFSYECASCEVAKPKASRPQAAVPKAAKKCRHTHEKCRTGSCLHPCCEHFKKDAGVVAAAALESAAIIRKTATVAPATGPHATPSATNYARGQEVLYTDSNGVQLQAAISHVDFGAQPPSYTVKFADGTERNTEASRIELLGARPPLGNQRRPVGGAPGVEQAGAPTPELDGPVGLDCPRQLPGAGSNIKGKAKVSVEQVSQVKSIMDAPGNEGRDKEWLVEACSTKCPHIPPASVRAIFKSLRPQAKERNDLHHSAAQQELDNVHHTAAQQEQDDEHVIGAAGIYGGDASIMASAQLGEEPCRLWGQSFGQAVSQVLAKHSTSPSGRCHEQLHSIEALLRSKLREFPAKVQRRLLGDANDCPMPTRVQEAAIVFESKEMGRAVRKCPECNEVRCFLDNEDEEDDGMCDLCEKRAKKDLEKRGSGMAPMFSAANKMHFRPVPWFLRGLRIVERQMIAMVNCYIDVHHLKYGMTATKGHAVSFPSGMDIMRVLPRLAQDCGVVIFRRKSFKSGKIYHYCVRKQVVLDALIGLKYGCPRGGSAERTNQCPIAAPDGRYYACEPCPPYASAEINFERIEALPEDDELPDLPVIFVDPKEATEGVQPGEKPKAASKRRKEAMSDLNLGPCPMQNELPGQSEYTEVEEFDTLDRSGVVTQKEVTRTQKEMQTLLAQYAEGDDPTKAGVTVCSMNAKESTLLKEMETPYFFAMYAPDVFICGDADITAPRERAPTLSAWINHIYWLEDNRVAAHPHLKYLLRSLKMRISALSQGSFCIKGASDLSRDDILAQLDAGDNSIVNRVLSVASNIPGTETYRRGLKQELSALSRFKAIGQKPYNNEHKSLPIIFHTGSCAEFHWKPLHKLCEDYLRVTNGDAEALRFRNEPLFRQQSLLRLGHVVTWYFDKRTVNFFKNVLPAILHDHGLDDHYSHIRVYETSWGDALPLNALERKTVQNCARHLGL